MRAQVGGKLGRGRVALRRVAGLSTELTDVTEAQVLENVQLIEEGSAELGVFATDLIRRAAAAGMLSPGSAGMRPPGPAG